MSLTVVKNLASRAEKVFTSLGSNPDPLITIIALCLFNATVRPLITLSDKNQPKERRYYAALREAVTEMIALPTCVLFARGIGGMLANKFATSKSPEVISGVKNVFSLLGLVAANFVIPILTTIALDPIMKDVKKRIVKDKQQHPTLDITSQSPLNNTPVLPPNPATLPASVNNVWQHYQFMNSTSMKVH